MCAEFLRDGHHRRNQHEPDNRAQLEIPASPHPLICLTPSGCWPPAPLPAVGGLTTRRGTDERMTGMRDTLLTREPRLAPRMKPIGGTASGRVSVLLVCSPYFPLPRRATHRSGTIRSIGSDPFDPHNFSSKPDVSRDRSQEMVASRTKVPVYRFDRISAAC